MNLTATLVLALLTLVGCAREEQPPDLTISRDELETEVAGMYPPKKATTTLTVTCGGDLAAEVDASQDCRVLVDERRAEVHVRVTGLDGNDPSIEAVPFVRADRVAEELLAALTEEGYHVTKVTCPGELAGTVGGEVTCTVVPNNGRGDVVVSVSEVRGLKIDFVYEPVS